MMFIAMALVAAPFALINQYDPRIIEFIIQQVTQHRVIFSLVRIGIILLVALFWPYFVRKISSRQALSFEDITYWQTKRLHVVMWLILFDVLICENVIGRVVHLIIVGGILV